MYIVISLEQLSALEIVDIVGLIRELPVEAGFATYQVADLKPVPVVVLATFNNSPEANEQFLNRFCEIIDRATSLRMIPYAEATNYLEWHYSR